MVYSTMATGLGFTNFHTLTGMLSLKPLHKKYWEVRSSVCDAVKEKVDEVLANSIEGVKRHYSPDNDGIYNVKVIFDGSWQKRGHTSTLAVGAIVEAETGCVIDYEVVSKYCELCVKK